MNKVFKYVLISIGLNILFVGLCLLIFTVLTNGSDSIGGAIGAFFMIVISLLVQLVVSVFFITNPNKKQLGQGMLIAVGIILLIGFSVCGGLGGLF